MGSGFSRHQSVKFHLSVKFSILQCKFGQPFSQFTSILYHPVATLSVHPNSIRLIARFETSCAVGQGSTPHDHYFMVVRRHRWRSRSSRLLESKFKRSVSIVFDFATGTRSGQEPSYVRKNSQMASFAKNNMPNTTWKSYARERKSTVHQ